MESQRIAYYKELGIGFVVGLLATVIGFFVYTYVYSMLLESTFGASLKTITQSSLFSKVLGLGAIVNLLAFFLFLKIGRELRARGVLLATVVVAVVIAIAKLVG